MKKQIIAAAVAATVSSVALADISITGAAKVNYTNVDVSGSTPDTNKFTQETDIKIKGKSGDTEVVVNFGGGAFDNAESTSDARTSSTSETFEVEDIYVSTNVAGVAIKTGTWDNGNNELRASSRSDGKFQATTSYGPVNLGFLTGSNGASQEEYTVSGDIAGVSLSYTEKAGGETVKASTSLGGVNLKYLGLPSNSVNSDRSYYELSSKVGDISLKYGKANADSSATIDGDTWMGDFEGATGAYALTAGQDVQSIEVKTAMAGNTVTFRNTQIDDVQGADTDFNKVIITRPLASGATFELTYTALDDEVNSNDSDTLDLELAVSF
jgi:hypothetical protein